MGYTLILLPAYNRKYSNNEDMLKDWIDGKDFRVEYGGPYTSIRDRDFIKSMGFNEICLTTKDRLSTVRFAI